jgi:hypothetical protein
MAASSYSCKHLLLCVLVVVFMAGMANAVNEEESALRGAIQMAMTEVGCTQGAACKTSAVCGDGYCVSCALLFRNLAKYEDKLILWLVGE